MAAIGAMGIAMTASTALSAAPTVYSTVNARNQAKAQSEQAEQNAKNAESQGRVEAERIRSLGQRQASAAKAQAAANGLDLNADNTVLNVIEDDISMNSSKDAWTTFFNAKNQLAQFQTDSSAYKSQGVVQQQVEHRILANTSIFIFSRSFTFYDDDIWSRERQHHSNWVLNI